MSDKTSQKNICHITNYWTSLYTKDISLFYQYDNNTRMRIIFTSIISHAPSSVWFNCSVTIPVRWSHCAAIRSGIRLLWICTIVVPPSCWLLLSTFYCLIPNNLIGIILISLFVPSGNFFVFIFFHAFWIRNPIRCWTRWIRL